MLILICEVCTAPMMIPKHIEVILSGCDYVICGVCKQASDVPDTLRKQIRKEWGMVNEQN